MIRRSMRWMALLALAVSTSTSFAQNTPTAEQLQIFQGLSPEQQQAVLQQMGGANVGANNGASAERNAVETGDTLRSRATTRSTEVAAAALAPNDVVVVELALPGTMSRGSVRSSNTQDPSVDTAPRRVRTPSSEPLSPEDLRRASRA